jgi:hypothetical protein
VLLKRAHTILVGTLGDYLERLGVEVVGVARYGMKDDCPPDLFRCVQDTPGALASTRLDVAGYLEPPAGTLPMAAGSGDIMLLLGNDPCVFAESFPMCVHQQSGRHWPAGGLLVLQPWRMTLPPGVAAHVVQVELYPVLAHHLKTAQNCHYTTRPRTMRTLRTRKRALLRLVDTLQKAAVAGSDGGGDDGGGAAAAADGALPPQLPPLFTRLNRCRVEARLVGVTWLQAGYIYRAILATLHTYFMRGARQQNSTSAGGAAAPAPPPPAAEIELGEAELDDALNLSSNGGVGGPLAVRRGWRHRRREERHQPVDSNTTIHVVTIPSRVYFDGLADIFTRANAAQVFMGSNESPVSERKFDAYNQVMNTLGFATRETRSVEQLGVPGDGVGGAPGLPPPGLLYAWEEVGEQQEDQDTEEGVSEPAAAGRSRRGGRQVYGSVPAAVREEMLHPASGVCLFSYSTREGYEHFFCRRAAGPPEAARLRGRYLEGRSREDVLRRLWAVHGPDWRTAVALQPVPVSVPDAVLGEMAREVMVYQCELRGKRKYYCLPPPSASQRGRLFDSDSPDALFKRLWASAGDGWRLRVALHEGVDVGGSSSSSSSSSTTTTTTTTSGSSSSESSSCSSEGDDDELQLMLELVQVTQNSTRKGARQFKVVYRQGGAFLAFGSTPKEACKKARVKCLERNVQWMDIVRLKEKK